MKKENYDTYEMLYAEYLYFYERGGRLIKPSANPEYYLVKSIRKSIDLADKENVLRPDAKYFLIVNFHHLIIKPLYKQLIKQRPSRDIIDENELDYFEEMFQSDIENIISESRLKQFEKDISGHQIMQTIDKLWGILKTTNLELWG